MNWHKHLLIWLSFFFLNTLFAEENKFVKANKAFNNGEYILAIDMYEALLEDAPSVHLYFNLASAYFEAGQIGKSILHYERALKLKPGDKEILHNLRLAYLATKDTFEPIPELGIVTFWKKLLCILTLNQWGMLGITLFWVSISMAIIHRFYKVSVFQKAAFVLFIFSLGITLLTWRKFQYENVHLEAIILSESVHLRSSPNVSSPELIEIFEGRKVKIIDQVDTWVKVQIDTEKAAWLEKKYLERI